MLIRRLSLKSVTVDKRLYTTIEWIEEYYAHRRSKDHHSLFNGRKVFDAEKGELSINMVAKEMGLHKASVDYYVRTGKLKTIRRGTYHVVLRKDLEAFLLEKYGNHMEIAKDA